VSVPQPASSSLRPGCEPECRGCRHRTLTAAASLAQKTAYLERVLAPWAAVLQTVRSVPPDRHIGYRDRVTLHARHDSDRGWRFGLLRRDELIAIHDCPVHSPRVNRLVAVLRNTLPCAARLPVAFLHVAGGQATLIVKAHRYDAADLGPLLAALPGTGIEGLWVHCHPSAGRKLFARSGWHLAWGDATSRDPAGLAHGPAAFQQLLPGLHRDSVQVAAAHLAPGPGVAVVDLYCGIGATLREWCEAGAAVLGIELAGGAVDSACRNAPRATVLRGTCGQRLPQVREWWTAQAADVRACYANPPRSGLEPEVLEALASGLRPDRLAYLSCSAGTLARDLAALEDAGYVVRALVPFDFFPGTHHVECLALVTRTDHLCARVNGPPSYWMPGNQCSAAEGCCDSG
jgi:23S rRNA (uracil1939-C5)-methyltransferase